VSKQPPLTPVQLVVMLAVVCAFALAVIALILS
jgi:hypothetical protein